MASWLPAAPRGTRPAWFGELAVIAALLFVYDRVANLASVRAGSAITHGKSILRWEHAAHVGVERAAGSVFVDAGWLSTPAALWYDFAHMTVTIGVLLALWVYRPTAYRWLRNVLVMVNLLALTVFLLWPVAPPRLLPGAGFRDVVALSHTPGSWDASSTLSRHANEYASAPSLHVAYALWVLLAAVLCTRRGWLRRLAALHLALTSFVVVGTGNHYLLDVVAGAAVVALAGGICYRGSTRWTALDDRDARPELGSGRRVPTA